jgi:2',3'-cyclic-nucleotide 2'-phosphodiesterase / 3'-nucleotidase / 5'-nucleotidase
MVRRSQKKALSLLVAVIMLLTVVFPVATFAETTTPPVFTIALLGTSDIHGQVMGYNYFTQASASGLTRVSTLVTQERTKYPNNILVDAGDSIQGTPMVYYYNKVDTSWMADPNKNYPMVEAYKYLKYDAWTLGNHEFNFGLNVLEPIIAEANAANIQVLSANTLDKNAVDKDPVTGDQPTWNKVKPYTIKTFKDPDGNDFKVAILGLTTPAIPNWESTQNYPGLQFGDIVTEGTKWVQYLKNDASGPKANAIIAVIHSGVGDDNPANDSTPFENEVLAFANANPQVNAIMTGHTHSALSGPIGTNNIYAVQPKNAGANLEEVAMNFVKDPNGNWTMATITGASLNASTSVAEDQALVTAIKPYHEAALNYLKTPVGNATDSFLANGQTIKDTALMDLVNKVQMYYGNADLSVAAPFSPTAKIPKGTVTIGDVSSVYIYENFLFTVKVNGAQLRKYLELSAGRYYKSYASGDIAVNKNSSVPDYNLDILQGAEYSVDLTKTGMFDSNGASLPGGQPRISKLKINGQDVQDNDVFKLALNNYRVNGGGGFLAAAGIVPQSTDPSAPNYITYDSQKELGDDGQVRSLMIKYFQDVAAGTVQPGKNSVEPTYDNNWQTVPRFLDIVGFTDTHGNIDNYPTTGTVKANAALLAGAVNKERATYGDERTIVLSSGDMLQGTPISNVLKGKPVIDVMNQMKFDAMEIGNHEFDWGIDTLNQNLSNAKFPFLVSNLALKAGDTDVNAASFLSNSKPYTIVDKDGVKVGIIGVINPETASIVMPSIINHFEITDPVAAVNKLVPQVKAAGAEVVIVLGHIADQYNYWPTSGTQPVTAPLSGDLANLAKGVTGVDAILGGHSHTTNYDLVPDATGKLIPAAIGYANGRGAAVIRLALDANDQVVGGTPNYLDVGNRLYSTLTPDPQVQAIVNAANAAIGPVFNEVIGKAEVDMTRSTATTGNLDSNLGDWAADVTKNAGQADFGFQNSGGLRIDIPKGDITVGQIWTLMPFDNEINTLDMTGAQVKNVLEYMVSGIKTPGHISGLRFIYDLNKPARFGYAADGKTVVVVNPDNSRVVKMTLPDGTPVDMNKVYKVAAPDFIATGGDNYPFVGNSTNLTNPHILVRDALINDLKVRKILNNLPDGRIQFYIAPTLTSTLPTSLTVIDSTDFSIRTEANSELDANVRVRITLTDPAQSPNLKLKVIISEEESNPIIFTKEGEAWFGPTGGFSLRDAAYNFNIKLTKSASYGFKLDLVEMGTGTILSSQTQTITVNPKH